MTIAPAKPQPASLYQLTLDSQEIDGELSIVLAKASSEDPDEQAEAEVMLESLLLRANTNQSLLLSKANGICRAREALLGKATYLRNAAADRVAKAEAEERAAQRLEDYLLRCLQALHPGQNKFKLPDFTISSRPSEAIEVDEDALAEIPVDLTRTTIEIKLTGAASAHGQDLEEAINAFLEAAPLQAIDRPIPKRQISADKTAIKAVIKAAIKEGTAELPPEEVEPAADRIAVTAVPGARLVKRRSWSIK